MKTEKKTYYLYHKISPLGLNYLGTTMQNPFEYTGSGKYWKNHLKAHKFTSNDVKTIILFETLNKDELITKALINRSDFLAKKSFVNAYKQNINISKADMFPKINLITQLSSISTDVTSYSLNNTKYDINNQTNVFDLLFKNTNFLYGFELKWKIFDGFTTNSNIQKSKLEYLNSIIELDEIKNRIDTFYQIWS